MFWTDWYLRKLSSAHKTSIPGLKWTVTGSTITAAGTGANPDFYSFDGNLSANGSTIVGTVYHPPFSAKHRTRCGSFAVTRVPSVHEQKPSSCHGGPKPSPPPPGPPGPPSPPAGRNPHIPGREP